MFAFTCVRWQRKLNTAGDEEKSVTVTRIVLPTFGQNAAVSVSPVALNEKRNASPVSLACAEHVVGAMNENRKKLFAVERSCNVPASSASSTHPLAAKCVTVGPPVPAGKIANEGAADVTVPVGPCGPVGPDAPVAPVAPVAPGAPC